VVRIHGRQTKMWRIEIMLFLVSVVAAQVRMDTNTTQLPTALPSWGGATGAGSKWCNAAFAGYCIIRLTDTSNTTKGTSLTTADTGAVRLVANDSQHVIVRNNEGVSFVVGFNPTTEAVTKTLFSMPYALQFGQDQPSVLYYLDHTAIHRIIMNASWTASLSDVVLYNYAAVACLGTSFVPTWTGTFSIQGTTGAMQFGASFSTTGPQGSGRYVVVWSAANGCSFINTATGLYRNGGVANPTNSVWRFYLHDSVLSPNGLWAVITPTVHQPSGAVGCLTQAKCPTMLFWRVGTSNVTVCGPVADGKWVPPYCDGHLAVLSSTVLSGRQNVQHSYADPNVPHTSMGELSATSPDSHPSEVNGADIGGKPLFVGTQQVASPSVYPTWGYNEIMSLALDGSKKWTRYGQTLNSGNSPNFVCQNAIIDVFQQGNYVLFTSDMGGNGRLGFESDGKTSRCDVFVMEVVHGLKFGANWVVQKAP